MRKKCNQSNYEMFKFPVNVRVRHMHSSSFCRRRNFKNEKKSNEPAQALLNEATNFFFKLN